MEKREFKAGEITLSIILVLFSIFAMYESYIISGKELTISSPGAFPMFISALLILFAMWIAIESYAVRIKDQKYVSEKVRIIANLVLPKDILMSIIFLIIYAIILEKTGFIIATILFLFTSISFLSKKITIKNFLISFIVVLLIVLIFNTIFNVVLP